MMMEIARWSVRVSLQRTLVRGLGLALGALLAAGCGDDGEGGSGAGGGSGGGSPSGGPGSGPGGGAAPLTPGAAGTGVLAYTVSRDGNDVVEVTDLDTAAVLYASDGEREGVPQRLFLTHSGGHLVWAGSADADQLFACWHVDLATGQESDCRITDPGYMLPQAIGVADGGRIAHTALTTDGRKVILIDDGAGPTEIATEAEFMPLNGGISPDGETVFALHYASASSSYAIWSYPIGGTPALVAQLPAGITTPLDRTIIDVSEGGDRLLFPCIDDAQQGLRRESHCTIDVATGTLTLLSALVAATMTPGGDRVIGARLDGGGFEVFEFGADVATREVPLEGASPTLSPDGERVAYRVIDSAPGQWYAPFTATLDGKDPVHVAAGDDSAPAIGVLRWSR